MVKKASFWLIFILLIAAALRFYNLSGYLQFLGDQGRDVIIVKNMIVDQKWTLLGPSASVGGFFTGPIYYYFMIPFLWLFQLDPVGPAYMTAIFGLATVYLIYWFSCKFFNPRVGLLAAFLVAISPKMVDISRFSWNPNPVPFFTLLTVAFLYLGAVKKKKIFTFLAGIGFGILFQLHYMSIALGAVFAVAMLFIFPPRQWLVQFFLAGCGFLLGNSMFLLFEIRHDFPNSRSVWEFVTRGGKTVSPRNLNFAWLTWEILRRLYGMLFGIKDTIWEHVYLTASFLGLGLWLVKERLSQNFKIKAVLIVTWLIIGALGIGFYQGVLNDHYFGYLYPVPFLLVAIAGDFLLRKKVGIPVFIIGLAFLTYKMITNLYFWQPPNNMLNQIQEIDNTILDNTKGEPYNLGLISSFNTDQAYRYYLEVWKRPPVVIENPEIDPQRQTVTSQLFVICEDKKCEPLGNPRWEIAGFGQAQIVSDTMGPAGIRVFKLIHL